MSSTQLVSIKNGQCFSAPGPYGAAMITAPCNNNDAKQKISISNWNTTDKVQLNANNSTIDTYQNGLYNSNECGKGNDCDFYVNNMVGNVGVGNGPFQFRGWGAGANYAYPNDSNAVVQGTGSVSTDTWWLTKAEADDCNAYGIPLYQCSPQNRKDCTLYKNYLRDTCQPSQCPTAKYIGDPTCQAYCTANAGKCDTAVAAYCAANPSDTNFCGCYNVQKYAAIIKLLGDNAQSFIPRCSIQECSSNASAYMTQNMLNTKCSDQNLCLQQLTVTTETTQLNDIVQSCSQKSNDNGTTTALSSSNATTSSSSSSTPTSTSSSSTSSKITTTDYIIGGVAGGSLLCILISIGVALYINKSK